MLNPVKQGTHVRIISLMFNATLTLRHRNKRNWGNEFVNMLYAVSIAFRVQEIREGCKDSRLHQNYSACIMRIEIHVQCLRHCACPTPKCPLSRIMLLACFGLIITILTTFASNHIHQHAEKT